MLLLKTPILCFDTGGVCHQALRTRRFHIASFKAAHRCVAHTVNPVAFLLTAIFRRIPNDSRRASTSIARLGPAALCLDHAGWGHR
jgi:hypothetical protein